MHVKHGLLLAVICYLAPTLPSQANDMLPFDTVRQQFRTTQDLTRVSHLYRRCAALHLNVAALLLKKKRGVAAKDYEHLANHFMMLSERLDIEIDKKTRPQNRQTHGGREPVRARADRAVRSAHENQPRPTRRRHCRGQRPRV